MRSPTLMLGLIVGGCSSGADLRHPPMACTAIDFEASGDTSGSQVEALLEWKGVPDADRPLVFEIHESVEPCTERLCFDEDLDVGFATIQSRVPEFVGLPDGAVRLAFEAQEGHAYRATLSRQRSGSSNPTALCEVTMYQGYETPVPLDALRGGVYSSRGDTFRLKKLAGIEDNFLEVLHMVWLPHLVVDAASQNDLDLSLAWPDVSEPDVPAQKQCTSTQSLEASFDNPHFTTAPTHLDVVTGMGGARVYDTVITGSFTDDGATLADVRFAGLFDLRDLAPEFRMTVAELCAELLYYEPFVKAYFGIEGFLCEPCPDGEPTCLWMEADNVTASRTDLAVEHGSDVCGIEGELARWDYELQQIYAIERGGSVVRALDLEGTPLWEVDTGAPLSSLQFLLQDSGFGLLAMQSDLDSAGYYWTIDRQTGGLIDQGEMAELEGTYGGGDLSWDFETDGFSWGGFSGSGGFGDFACAAVSLGMAGAPLPLIVLSVLGLLGRVRRRAD